MRVIDTELPEVKIIELDVYEDERGSFMESWQIEKFSKQVLPTYFVQDNHSVSKKGVLRGLHFQTAPYEQGKLVRVVKGKAFDVAVDIRPDSVSYGKHVAVELSESNRRMLWIPEGFAHGFLALEEDTHFLYKTTNVYNKESERSFHWNSEELAIEWPLDSSELIVSEKDSIAPEFVRVTETVMKAEKQQNSLIHLTDVPFFGDERGSLIALESLKSIPFPVKRIYSIFGTGNGVSRGFHAHRNLKQIAVCITGSCRFLLDDGQKRESVVLNNPQVGLSIEHLTWREMHDFSDDCVLLVIASEYFDESDYIRDYSTFLEMVKTK